MVTRLITCSNLENRKKALNELVDLAKEISRQNAEGAKWFLLTEYIMVQGRQTKEETIWCSS